MDKCGVFLAVFGETSQTPRKDWRDANGQAIVGVVGQQARATCGCADGVEQRKDQLSSIGGHGFRRSRDGPIRARRCRRRHGGFGENQRSLRCAPRCCWPRFPVSRAASARSASGLPPNTSTSTTPTTPIALERPRAGAGGHQGERLGQGPANPERERHVAEENAIPPTGAGPVEDRVSLLTLS